MIPKDFSYKISEDLIAIDGKKLLAKEEAITFQRAQQILQLSPGFKQLALKETAIFNDLLNSLKDSNYQNIFREAKEISQIQEILSSIAIEEPLIAEFKQMADKDQYTYRHIFAVTSLTALISLKMGYSSSQVKELTVAALLHDFGKMRVPGEVLQSNQKLNPAKQRYIKEHPLLGYLLLVYYSNSLDNLNCRVALLHHEKTSGIGYPLSIRQNDQLISLITVNDIYDALISRRTYRQQPFDIRGALDLLWDEVLLGNLPEIAVRYLIALNRSEIPEEINKMPVHRVKSGLVPEKNNYGGEEE